MTTSRFVLPLLLGWAASAGAQTYASAPQRAAQPAKISAREATQLAARVLRETSAIRQLSIRRAVPSGVQGRAQIEAMVGRRLQEDVTSSEIAGEQIFLIQLGLAPARFDLKRFYVRMMGEQIAGYYDSRSGKFYTSDRVDPRQLEIIMAHELTHALQDQHFDLKRLENWPAHDSDAQLAMSALVEGDATFTMARYMARSPLRLLDALASSLSEPGASAELSGGPQILQQNLVFPYRQGLSFVSNLHRLGGWNAVSDAFSHLPQSSEQILHFDKYLAREAPVAVPPRDLSRSLGRGWQRLDHDVNGEFGLSLVASEFLKGRDPLGAAMGWGGDRYTVYRGPGNAALVVQESVWDDDAAARRWQQTYAQRSDNRFKIKSQRRGALQIWNAAPRGVWMERRDRRVLVLEGTVGAFNPERVMAALQARLATEP